MTHCGGVGTGGAVKICNNMLLAVTMIGTSEAMNLGIKLGLDPKLLAGIMGSATGRCWPVDTYNPCPGVFDNVPSRWGFYCLRRFQILFQNWGTSELICCNKVQGKETPAKNYQELSKFDLIFYGIVSSNDYKGGFGTALMTKDLGLAQDAATRTQAATPLGSLAHQMYRVMCNAGYAEKDFSSAFKFLKEQ